MVSKQINSKSNQEIEQEIDTEKRKGVEIIMNDTVDKLVALRNQIKSHKDRIRLIDHPVGTQYQNTLDAIISSIDDAILSIDDREA